MDDVQAHSQPGTYTLVLLHSETKGGSLSVKGDPEAGGSVSFLLADCQIYPEYINPDGKLTDPPIISVQAHYIQ